MSNEHHILSKQWKPETNDKLYNDKANPCCLEFTVPSSDGKPVFGVLTILVLSFSLFVKFNCLQEYSCHLQDFTLLAVLVIVTFVYFLHYFCSVQKESLLLVIPMGLQMSTVTRFGRQNTTWIPWCLIENFMILDVITGQKVIFCLAASIKESARDKEKTLILFRNTKPRLSELECIYRALQGSLEKHR